MKVQLTFEVTDEDRRAIAARVGNDRPATHAEVKRWAASLIDNELDQLTHERESEDESR